MKRGPLCRSLAHCHRFGRRRPVGTSPGVITTRLCIRCMNLLVAEHGQKPLRTVHARFDTLSEEMHVKNVTCTRRASATLNIPTFVLPLYFALTTSTTLNDAASTVLEQILRVVYASIYPCTCNGQLNSSILYMYSISQSLCAYMIQAWRECTGTPRARPTPR